MTAIQIGRGAVAEISLGAVADRKTAVDVWFAEPGGRRLRVPAFASGGQWKVRYSSFRTGTHRYEVQDSDEFDSAGATGTVEVVVQAEARGLVARGPIRVTADQRHFEHADGTPFCWLADTWWYGFAERLEFDEFRRFAAARAEQGFSVIQIVAGLYPESEPFAPAARSRSGWVWDRDSDAPNTEWFDEADQRIAELIALDLVPCIVGAWGHYYSLMDVSQLNRHWRELIARWGAYPVVWCLAGEASLPATMDLEDPALQPAITAASTAEAMTRVYGSEQAAISYQLKAVNDIARTVREVDAFGRPVTIHSVPRARPWEYLEDESVVDFWLLQTGHQGHETFRTALDQVHAALDHQPVKPVINGEPSYEGIAGSSWQDLQRFMFWSHLLSGTAGHSYGAHGVWAFNDLSVPGLDSGLAPDWREAATLPGARQLGIGRNLLLSLPWGEFEPHPEWVTPSASSGDRSLPYAAGQCDGPRVFYFPPNAYLRNVLSYTVVKLHDLGDHPWHAQLIDPSTGSTQHEFVIDPDGDGSARLRSAPDGLSTLPGWADWLLVLRPAEPRDDEDR
ncbi:DUF4038 domain-containing protein [Kribbella hippodromi]|uniref:DUF4038 domain-containing protein n=1 Tax=Kribbella hippodromi TaxID=434347 RepID=A0ABN2CTL7_9ACTN